MISSPRILRPFTATLIHKIDDESFITVELKYVAFDESYGIKQSNKGISDADNVLLTIDLNDCGGMKYVDEIYFKREKNTFTISNEDYFVIGNVTESDFDTLRETMNVYSINKFSFSRTLNSKEVQFIEVYAS